MLLDRSQLEKAASAGDPEAGICPIMINDDPDITFRSPYEYIYARYDRKQSLQVSTQPSVSMTRALQSPTLVLSGVSSTLVNRL